MKKVFFFVHNWNLVVVPRDIETKTHLQVLVMIVEDHSAAFVVGHHFNVICDVGADENCWEMC